MLCIHLLSLYLAQGAKFLSLRSNLNSSQNQETEQDANFGRC
jgi:hypothetical protein